MMKTLAVLYFALALSTAALPQAVTEWRPTLAEDNKAATIEDTLTFIVATANDTTVDQVDIPEDKHNWEL